MLVREAIPPSWNSAGTAALCVQFSVALAKSFKVNFDHVVEVCGTVICLATARSGNDSLIPFFEIYVYEMHFLIPCAAAVGPDKLLCLIFCMQRSKQKMICAILSISAEGIDLISNIQTN